MKTTVSKSGLKPDDLRSQRVKAVAHDMEGSNFSSDADYGDSSLINLLRARIAHIMLSRLRT